ncbi:MAG: DNA-binding protein [Quisquiliibacterium sp.]
MSQENEIAAEIEQLRSQFPKTRELYREVCVLLFFRHGITPTANRLYQLVRKGSMATPAQVLGEFWKDLRERSRARIEHSELPEALREAAGTVMLQLWDQAQQAALDSFQERLASEKQSAYAASQRAAEAVEKQKALQAELEERRLELAAARAGQTDLEIQLTTIQGRLLSMTEMLRDQGSEMDQLRAELDQTRRDIARAVGEADSLRTQLAKTRSRDARKPSGSPPKNQDPDQAPLELGPASPLDE